MSSKQHRAPISLTRQKGILVIISSPSGGGKTSICRRLLSPRRRRDGWQFSISYTTRPPRSTERNGREYVFVTEAKFRDLVSENFFAEHCTVHLWQYGTPRKPLEQVRSRGGVMVLDVDVQGAGKLYKEYPDAAMIFILPPSANVLKERLRKRGTERAAQRKLRLENALSEMRSFRSYGFKYVVVNETLESAADEVLSIITAHQCRIEQLDPEQIRKITG